MLAQKDSPPMRRIKTIGHSNHPIEHFLGLGVTAHLRTDHDHVVTGVTQRARLLPDPPIQRDGQVLDHDEDGRLAHDFTNRTLRIVPAVPEVPASR